LHPVALTIFGGLVTATMLDTFLTPTLFLRYGRKPLERLLAQVRDMDTAAVGTPSASKSLETF
jgi:HME family heavy-metal exporter